MGLVKGIILHTVEKLYQLLVVFPTLCGVFTIHWTDRNTNLSTDQILLFCWTFWKLLLATYSRALYQFYMLLNFLQGVLTEMYTEFRKRENTLNFHRIFSEKYRLHWSTVRKHWSPTGCTQRLVHWSFRIQVVDTLIQCQKTLNFNGVYIQH